MCTMKIYHGFQNVIDFKTSSRFRNMDSARSATTLDLGSIARKARKSNRTFKEILREKLPETRLRRIRSAIGTRPRV